MPMTQTCTQNPNDVIRYLYGETSGEENDQMEELLAKDSGLLAWYLDCLDIQLGLNQIEVTPSAHVVNRILDFSRSYVAE